MPDDAAHASSAALLPRLQLDELLGELRSRLGALAGMRDRMRGLLGAVLAIGSDLELEQVLRRIIQAAMDLVDARYGAMGVLTEEGDSLARFIPIGMAEEDVAAIGHYPTGEGILGLLIREPHVLRLADLADHRASVGFPPNHPPMRTFLGAPVRVRGQVYGNLYLCERRDGGEFDADDEIVLEALASAAGVAIDNARMYAQTRRRERWAAAASEVLQQLMSGTDPNTVLELIVDRTREIADATLVAIALPDGESGDLRIGIATGAHAEQVLGAVLPAEQSISSHVLATGKVELAADARHDDRVAQVIRTSGLVGPALYVPLGAPGRVRGVLMIGNAPGGASFSENTVEVLNSFAGQAAVALELAERQRDAERLSVFEDRDRIARDLHDLVIQRLFATSMSLQSVTRLIDRPEAVARVRRAVGDLDETIRDIRSTIFALHDRADESTRTLRQQAAAEADAARAALGFSPALRFDGPIDTLTDDRLTEHAVAVIREGLANCAKHAAATRVEVAVHATPDELAITIRDNGVGIAPAGRRSGLSNLEARAAALDGTCTVTAGPEGGTTLQWAVPLL